MWRPLRLQTMGKLFKYGIEMYYFRKVIHSGCDYFEEYDEESSFDAGPLAGFSTNNDDDDDDKIRSQQPFLTDFDDFQLQ